MLEKNLKPSNKLFKDGEYDISEKRTTRIEFHLFPFTLGYWAKVMKNTEET